MVRILFCPEDGGSGLVSSSESYLWCTNVMKWIRTYLTLPLSMALTPSAVLPPGLVTSHLEYVRRVLNLEDTSVGYNIL